MLVKLSLNWVDNECRAQPQSSCAQDDSPVVSTLLMLTVTMPVGWKASATVMNIELLQMHTIRYCNP